ncbi:hypothetical protein MtrunA17_Chr2g0316941 [Medicago truncatula]|uniref:Uncharacterized protein n=1 Tax=Medicago truncatula TaxID=3880 RepID=I3S689_MEDTR|nr:unknown [Medicago truncatula]RHN75050.1 hypothetical protein MtrunA17_Chr2g0316941 [Medicago truncatula]
MGLQNRSRSSNFRWWRNIKIKIQESLTWHTFIINNGGRRTRVTLHGGASKISHGTFKSTHLTTANG